jgi:ParB-like chromosome segregation protein Spo0J
MSTGLKFHPVAELFPLVEGEAFDRLVEDIRTNGLLEAIWLHPDGSIIDGRNRYRACRKAKIEPKTRVWRGKGSLVEFVLSMNLHRRHLTSSQLGMVAVDLLPMLEAEAKERQKEHGGTAPGRGKTVSPKLDEVSVGRSDAKAAAILGVSRGYVADAKKLSVEAPHLAAEVRAGTKTLQDAKREIVEAKREGKREENRWHIKARKDAIDQPVCLFRWMMC